ncbi:MAG TPA: M14 family zinc carboxypeptidase [Acidobacteriota bacterium]|nr:M14 family zinc carboxypeptidase [Acidobacteriota bacterium]
MQASIRNVRLLFFAAPAVLAALVLSAAAPPSAAAAGPVTSAAESATKAESAVNTMPEAGLDPGYLPAGVRYDPDVPSPEEFLGYAVGERFTRHDRLVAYFRQLGLASERARFQVMGQTYEMRPLIRLTVTVPSRLENLEEARLAHLRAADPANPEEPSRPVVILLGYGVHGNESSSAEAAMLAAYHFCAAQGQEVDSLLQSAVILFDPVYNPDGRDRASHWFSMHRSRHLSADRWDREHNEGWPSGRTNHYWFDLNRDWLPAVHVESQTRIRAFHNWLPNVTTDYHEMGSNSTYFFEPTEEANQNPLVPAETYQLTAEFSKAWEEALEEIGSLYYTRQVYDDFYPGYGSSYPDLHGGIGVLFEQASSRGHVQETVHGRLSFAFTIRNQVRTSLATVQRAVELRPRLLKLQRDFFASALKADGAEEAYVFGEPHDASREAAFLELLRMHRIRVHRLQSDASIGGMEFPAGQAWIVPLSQRQRRMVQSIFETRTEFADSLFYDTSAWSMAHAYGIPHAQLPAEGFSPDLLGPELSSEEADEDGSSQDPPALEPASFGYLFEWTDSGASALLEDLLRADIRVKTAMQPFAIGGRSYRQGSMLVPVSIQEADAADVHEAVSQAASRHGIAVQALENGRSSQGPDLGSNDFRLVPKPRVLLLLGPGLSAYEAGEVWHLLDTRVGMPFTKADISDFGRLPLEDYDTLIAVSGSYSQLDESDIERIKNWMTEGNTLIALRQAVPWAIRSGLADEKLIAEEGNSEEPQQAAPAEETPRHDYASAREVEGSKVIGGAIFETDLDLTHPLGFGYTRRQLSVYRSSSIFLEPSRNPYSSVAVYSESPLISGYISPENLQKVAGSASVVVSGRGRGRAVLFVDNPNFRGFWHGTSRMFVNAVFLGSLIDVPRVR